MTNEDLVKAIAHNPIVSQNIEDVREQITDSQRLVQQTVHRHAKGFWLKENNNFTLSAGSHTINLRGPDYFPDLVDARFFWTTTGPIDVKPEKWFRKNYPDPTGTGTPTKAIWLTSYYFRFYPTPTSDTTIYLSYLFKPNFSDIEEFPDFLHDIIQYGVLSSFEDIPSRENSFTRGKWTKLYLNELNMLGQESRPPSSEWEPEFIFNKDQGTEMMFKMRSIAFSLLLCFCFVSPVIGQVNDAIPESDTVYVIEARASVRFNLNDYGDNNIWPDSVIDDWLNQSCKEIASQGVYVRRDTFITADTVIWYPLNADFMRVKNVFIKYSVDSRWYEIRSQKDSLLLPEIIKRDTIITTANTVWYALNTDIMQVREVMVKDKGDRWKGLNPKGGKVWARDNDIGINTYEIDGAFLRIDRPSQQAGDSIIIVYNTYIGGVKSYDVDSKHLHLDVALTDVGDSVIVTYSAFANDLTGGDSTKVNLPYEYQIPLIEGAVKRALHANQK